MPQWNNPDMIICDRFRALREEKKLKLTSKSVEAVAQAHKIHRDLNLEWWASSWHRPQYLRPSRYGLLQ
jgi:hypothetical protein